jgi:hypothetical protein
MHARPAARRALLTLLLLARALLLLVCALLLARAMLRAYVCSPCCAPLRPRDRLRLKKHL